ncbi:hypothetical protein MED01_006092 [Micromonospora sp. MED01]|uniref:hypothetical protein n=1 Tax=Micromonospora alfalfae TaxID=2911212 RepID=UPI001EE88F17|nr:hypothetical protein [Micromonospora alfalfae]MCG5467042.1 hypothetical protein [Micromonospora alfalfae]
MIEVVTPSTRLKFAEEMNCHLTQAPRAESASDNIPLRRVATERVRPIMLPQVAPLLMFANRSVPHVVLSGTARVAKTDMNVPYAAPSPALSSPVLIAPALFFRLAVMSKVDAIMRMATIPKPIGSPTIIEATSRGVPCVT